MRDAHLGGHTGFLGTLPLTIAHMATLPACLHHLTGTESRVHIVGLLDNETISDKLPDVLAWGANILLRRSLSYLLSNYYISSKEKAFHQK